MKNRIIVLCGAFLCLLLKASFAENPPFMWPSSYTIEYYQKSPGDPCKNVYSVSGNKTRTEITNLKINNTTIYIFDLDKQVMFTFMPSWGVYKEDSIKGMKYMKIQNMFDTSGTWQKVAVEEIKGVEADKYKLSDDKSSIFLYVWLSQKNHEPLQMINSDGSWNIEVNRFEAGPIDDSQFNVPSGFKNFDNLPHSATSK